MIVMMICHYDDTNSSGGLEKQAGLLSRSLKAAGERVVVLGSTRKVSRARWTDDGGVPVRLFWTYASPQVSGRYLPAALLWAVQLLVWVACNRRRVDVLHGHQIRIHAFAAALAGLMFGIPSILKSATGGAGADIKAIGSRKYFGVSGRRFVVRETDVFVATTGSIREDLLAADVPDDRIVVIPNGMSMPACPEGQPSAARHARCLFLGRLAADKNAPGLARAGIAVATSLGLSIDIYGQGEEQALVEAILAENPDSGVRYVGFVEDTSAVLPDYGWLLLPSDAEGLSNAMVEAMAAGVVPVTTRVSGCVDHIVPGQTGFFLDGVDDASLQAGLRQIGSVSPEDWRAMSIRVGDHARAHFEIGKVVERYRDLYRSLSKRRRSARAR